MSVSESEVHPYREICEPIDYENKIILSAKSNSENMNFNIYIKNLPEKTPGGSSIREFFADLRANIKAKISKERAKVKEALKCIETKSMDECILVPRETFLIYEKDEDWDYKFSDVIRDARYSLIMASRPTSSLGKLRDVPGRLNTSMDSKGVYKKIPWAAPSREEIEDATRTLNSHYQSAQEMISPEYSRISDWRTELENRQEELKRSSKNNSEAQARLDMEFDQLRLQEAKMRSFYNPNNTKHRTDMRSLVNAKRQLHHSLYVMLMGYHPTLQFIQSENPSKSELKNALNQTLAALDEEEKELEKNTSSLDAEMNLDLTNLILYRAEVQDVLLKKDKYCGLIRDLEQLRKAKDLGFEASIALPLLAASVLAPYAATPIRAAALTLAGVANAGGSVAIGLKNQREIDRSSYQVVARLNNQNEGEYLKDRFTHLNDLAFDRDVEYVLGVAGAGHLTAGAVFSRIGGFLTAKSYRSIARKYRDSYIDPDLFTRRPLRRAAPPNP